MAYHDELLALNGETEAVLASGELDVFISGLLTGSVKLQIKFSKSEVEDPTTWRDLPDGTFTSDTMQTLDVGEDQVRVKAVGVSNTAGVYVRFGRV